MKRVAGGEPDKNLRTFRGPWLTDRAGEAEGDGASLPPFLQGVTPWRTSQPILWFENERLACTRNPYGCR